ncbi:hypothetical protein U91I_02887 [alpha proteobacterium U9-1i]|nr:hypothetical protein U91I_02887 [alpha proteobacterium U9-1i]
MRAHTLPLALLAFLALAGCGDAVEPVSQAQASVSTSPPPLLGAFKAQSETARAVTGNVRVERGGLLFANGVTLYTRGLEPRRGHDRIARGGESYAAAVVGSSNVVVELRRVNQQVISPDAAAIHGACDTAEPPRYLAIVYEPPARTMKLIVFTGDEAPGPDATDSRVCAIYGFMAPEGARTREGVVL